MNWVALQPLFAPGALLAAAVVVVFVSLKLETKDRYVLPWLAASGCLAALGLALTGLLNLGAPGPSADAFAWQPGTVFLRGAFSHDCIGAAFSVVAILAALGAILAAAHEEDSPAMTTGEFYGLILLAAAGACFLAMAHDYLTLLISLEIMSVATYVLAGARREESRSSEAALKYLILGGFSTAFLLLGIAFIYGATGSLSLGAVETVPGPLRLILICGLGLLLAGVLFKVGAVPFHFWIPDVYEGAPSSVGAFMAMGVKGAGVAVVARVALEAFGRPMLRTHWTGLLVAAAAATMIWGNLAALQQDRVKRLLAYSAIAHTGYVLLAFLLNPWARPAHALTQPLVANAFFYLLAYGAATVGAFAVAGLARGSRRLETLGDYAGLAQEHPALAFCMAVFMLSLAGLPPLAGFLGKFLVFRSAIVQGYVAVAIVGILASIASFYYYLRVPLAMYLRPAETVTEAAPVALPWTSALVIYGCALATLALGLWPNWLGQLH